MIKPETEIKIIICVFILIVGFIVGRGSVKQAVAQVTSNDTIKTDSTAHSVTQVVTVKEPTGKVTTTRTTDTVKTEAIIERDKVVAVIPQVSHSKNNISVLAWSRTLSDRPRLGLSVSRELIGPVTVGAFGLVDGTIGLSVGVNF